MNKKELEEEFSTVKAEYEKYKSMSLKLDMSRGKSSDEQVDFSRPMLDLVNADGSILTGGGVNAANYGGLDGIPEMKVIFAELMGVAPANIIVGGNSSLNIMYDSVVRAMMFGVAGGDGPWSKSGKIKFLCPSPGYDRHFSVCEVLGIEMITVPMLGDGPDMGIVEELVNNDKDVKGIWCVPKYSNPTGETYSDEVVRRFAALKPASPDFRIFWDNAYCVHHVNDKHPEILNILDECEKAGNPDMVYLFASTSKITFPGAGVAAMAASENNIKFILKQLFFQTIGPDKLNQLRHARFLKNLDGVKALMEKHKKSVAPKFKAVTDKLDSDIAPLGIAKYTRPDGGYFISFDGLEGTAKRTVALCVEAGVVTTPAGATFPYGKDPRDSNLRIAPTFPPVSELKTAMELFCVCVKYAALEKLMG